MRQNESIVVVVTCRRRLGAGVAAAGRGCARARGAAASEFVRLVGPHVESANVDKEGCSSLAAARGARAWGAGARAGIASAILVVGCRHDARVSAGRSRVANIGCISGRGARRRGRRCGNSGGGARLRVVARRRQSPRSGDGACGAAAARVWSAWRRRGAGGARARGAAACREGSRPTAAMEAAAARHMHARGSAPALTPESAHGESSRWVTRSGGAQWRRRRRVRDGRAGVGGSLGKKYTLGVSITAPRGASVRP